MVQFEISFEKKLNPDRKVKLGIAGNPENLSCIWAGPSLLSLVSGENMVRMWNLQCDEN